MTAPTTTAPGKDKGRDKAKGKGNPAPHPPQHTDPFDRDALPTPPGATAALLRSLLAPLRSRVVLTSVLLLLQQAAVERARCSSRTPSTAAYRRSGATTTAR